MAVRVNSIQTPREEMAELQVCIEHEREARRSLRISLSPEYYSAQKEYLEQQIAVLQGKLDTLNDRFNSGENELEASYARQKRLECRYNSLKHRDKIERMEQLAKQIEEIRETLK